MKSFFFLAILLSVKLAVAQETSPQILSESVHKTALSYADVECRKDTTDCYGQMILKFSEKLGVNRMDAISSGIKASLNGYTAYQLGTSKTKNVYVFIHGLWNDQQQYQYVQTLINNINVDKYIRGFHNTFENSNYIRLTLPGHHSIDKEVRARDKKILRKATATDWVKTVDETIRIAAHLGDNVIVIGQSTGGLLALIAAERFSDIVKKIVISEPAIRIQGHLKTASCELSGFLSVFNTVAGKPIDGKLSMGCHVVRLGNEFLKQFGGKTDAEQIINLAKSVKVPVLMFNNENDGVVVEAANRILYDNLIVEKHYVSLGAIKGKIDHGHSEYTLHEELSKDILDFINGLLPPAEDPR